MAQDGLIQVRVDEALKRDADALFKDLGLDTQTAIRIFLRQAIKRQGMPFEVAQPKDGFYCEANLRALAESMKQLAQGKVVSKTIAELEAMADE